MRRNCSRICEYFGVAGLTERLVTAQKCRETGRGVGDSADQRRSLEGPLR
jgi:hypothetical protein